MGQDVITVGSTMRIPLLYRGEYFQWREMFLNYLEENTDGEAMIHSITHGEQPLPVMCGSEYGEQDRKAAILYEYETFKAIEGEQLLDTYLRYLQVINDLKKCGYNKDNYELNYKFMNNLQPEWKQYDTLMGQTHNLMDITIDALYNILKQNQGDLNDAIGYKKKEVMATSDPLTSVVEKTKVSKSREKVIVQSESEGSDDEVITSTSTNKKQEYVKSEEKKEDKKFDEKKWDMSKIKMLLAKKDGDEQVLLAEDQAWMESSIDSDQDINANMVL
ncbi:hypothetical protein Tco_0896485, partial [Tanacetum coccineum]